MKIEKISDTQIKFYLTKEDLEERNLKIAELAMGSEKAQMLFRDIMEQAMEECGFEVNNSALMIEAVPASNESIMIIVSKVSEDSQSDNSFSLTPESRDKRRFRKSALDAFGDIYETGSERKYSSRSYETSNVEDDRVTVFSFASLDDASAASLRLNKRYTGSNMLYKLGSDYYLVAHNDNISDHILVEEMDSILSEYGQKRTSNLISEYYLEEHGEVIIKKDAVNILCTI